MIVDQLRDRVIAVLLGGTSPELEVSLQSGNTVCQALRELGTQVCPIDPQEQDWMAALEGVELAFIALHGCPGEDGVVQGALQTLAIPYTGSGVLASALAMDKVASKRLWRGIGLPTARFLELHADTDWSAAIDELGAAFVKPAAGGSSIGIAGARTADELQAAWQQATQFSNRVIAEQLIGGPEYTVAILGDRALPAIKTETDNEFYDYEAKYLSDDTRYLCPCGLSASEEAELAKLSLQAFTSLGCSVWGRVDVMRGSDSQFYLLEVNTVPGMTSHSLVPMAARAAGIELTQLVGQISCMSMEGRR